MSNRSMLQTLAIAVVSFGASAVPAAAQGQGYGVGEWNLVTYGGGSVCYVVLSNRFIPQQSAFRAFVRGGARCRDPRAQAVAMWVVRGNSLKLADGEGREIAALDQQSPDQYAAGDWALHRAGTGYAPQPGPGYTPPGDRPGQGYARGEWRLINESNGSVCRLTLSNRLVPQYNAYRAYVQGGSRCHDWIGQSVAIWVVRGNTLHLATADGRELAKLEQNGPNQYVGGGLVLERRGAGY